MHFNEHTIATFLLKCMDRKAAIVWIGKYHYKLDICVAIYMVKISLNLNCRIFGA